MVDDKARIFSILSLAFSLMTLIGTIMMVVSRFLEGQTREVFDYVRLGWSVISFSGLSAMLIWFFVSAIDKKICDLKSRRNKRGESGSDRDSE